MSRDVPLTAEEIWEQIESEVLEAGQDPKTATVLTETGKNFFKSGMNELISKIILMVDDTGNETLVKYGEDISRIAELKTQESISAHYEGLIQRYGAESAEGKAYVGAKAKVDARIASMLSEPWAKKAIYVGSEPPTATVLLKRLFPTISSLNLDDFNQAVGLKITAGLCAIEVIHNFKNGGDEIGAMDAILSTLQTEVISSWGPVANFIKGSAIAGRMSLSSFMGLACRANIIGLLSTALYYGSREAFDFLGVYENETFIEASNTFGDLLTQPNSFKDAETLAQVVNLFTLVNKGGQFSDAALYSIFGHDEFLQMDIDRVKKAYIYFCERFDVAPGLIDTTDNFAKSVIGNLGVFLKDKNLVGALSIDPIFTEDKYIAGAEALAYRFALVQGSYFAVVGADYSAYANELSLYNPATGTGVLTSQYLNDRKSWIATLQEGGNRSPFDITDIDSGVTSESQFYVADDGTRVPGAGKIILGSLGADTLQGSEWNDHLYGGAGADTLLAGEGANYLEGGTGADKYYINNDGDADTILDVSQGNEASSDKIYIDNALVSGTFTQSGASSDYFGADKKYKITTTQDNSIDLYVLTNGAYRKAATLLGYSSGKYGIRLQESQGNSWWQTGSDFTPPTSNYINIDAQMAPFGMLLRGNAQSGEFTGSPYGDIVITGGGTGNYVSGAYGNDLIIGGASREWIRAGQNLNSSSGLPDNDTVAGGANTDIIYGGAGDDILFADNFVESYLNNEAKARINAVSGDAYAFDTDGYLTETVESATEHGDYLSGELGNDTIVGSNRSDVLLGGQGSDNIKGGAGADLLLGDAQYTFMSGPYTTITDAYKYKWDDATSQMKRMPSSSIENTVVYTHANAFTWSWSVTASGDYVITPYNSFLNQIRVTVDAGDDFLDGGLGNDWIAGQAGNDTLEGGDGDDILYGDDAVPLAWGVEGNDNLYAGNGKDRLYGGGGNDLLDATEDDNDKDILDGGADNDVLKGGTGHDELYGGSGNDELYAGSDGSILDGGAGSDLLFGGEGDDELIGGDGEDWIVLGQGNDSVRGGAGADYFLYSLTDLQNVVGTSSLEDASTEDKIYIGGVNLASMSYRKTAGNRWVSGDGLLELTLNEGLGLVIKAFNDDGVTTGVGRVLIKNFSNGVAGIDLSETPETPPPENHAPTVNQHAPNQTGKQGEVFTYVLPESLFIDEDGDAMTYTVSLADGSALPPWLSYNATSRTLSGTPTNHDVGNLNLKVTATDKEGLSASQTFGLNIENVNDAPTANGTIPNQSAKQGEAFNFALPFNAFTDIDVGDTLAYSATLSNGSALPNWLTINTATGALSGTPNAVANLSIIITATDSGGLTAQHTFVLTITDTVTPPTNHAPTVNQQSPNQTGKQGEVFTYVLPESLFIDEDGDVLTYTVSLADGSALPSWLSYNATSRTLSGTPTNHDVGNLNLKVTATDPAGLSASQTFELTVSSALYNEIIGDSDTMNILTGTAANEHMIGNQGFDYLAGSGGDDWLEGKGGVDYLYGQDGDDTLDGGDGPDTLDGGSGNDTYLFGRGDGQDTIQNNSASYLTDTDVLRFKEGITADQLWFKKNGNNLEVALLGASDKVTLHNWFTSDADKLDVFETANGNKLTADKVQLLVNAMAGLTMPNQSNLPTDGVYSSLAVLIAQCWGGEVLTPTNHAPTVNQHASNQTGKQGEVFTYVLPESLFIDEDGDVLTYTVSLADGSALPSWLSYNATSRTLSGTPTNHDVGNLNLKVTATDPAGLSASQTFGLSVAALAYQEVIGTSETMNIILGTRANEHMIGRNGFDYLEGGEGDDWLEGKGGVDYLYGQDGNDLIEGGAGADTLNGGAGSDTYLFGRGDGQDSLNNYSGSYATETDVLKFKEGITADQLWFKRNGLNLDISIIGTEDKISISGWFVGDAYHVDQCQLANGQKLLESQVNHLVNAMASFTPPAAGQTTLPQNVLDVLQPVIAASWK
jgi:Ca2+-binding RTX toxin-like protein